MFRKLNPSLSFLLLAALLWIIQYSIDLMIGDGDGRITFLDAYVFVGFVQLFFILFSLVWVFEVIRRLRGNFASTSEEFLKRNSKSVFVCIILFFILCIDLIGFAFFDERELERVSKESYYRVQHPCFHHGLLQNTATEALWGDIKYPFYTNSFGFIDSAVFEVKQNLNKKQVVFIGDSFTEGVGVRYENTFFGRIRKEFSNNKEIEIWNAGCMSYSPLIYYNKIKYYTEVENIKIDYLWVFIDASDIQDELHYKDFQPNCTNIHIPKSGTVDYYRYKIITDNSIFDIYRNHSLLLRLISNTYKKFFTNQNADEKMFYINNRLAWLDDDEVYQDWGKEGVKLSEQHMQSLVEICKEKNIKLSIAVYPWNSMITNYDRQLKIWTSFSQKNNIPLLNLFPVFEEKLKTMTYKQVEEKYFIKGDGHWNSEGHLLVKNTLKPIFQQRILKQIKVDSVSYIPEL
ncbi:hypothetical protein WAF17_12765 [Bernardetia sp. ABR2-2B]|uniref:hypothetical protein n=1 Tax=Bernardetia sp. ABR2-2B TaxID=3127472 RepID=UPI0030D1907D